MNLFILRNISCSPRRLSASIHFPSKPSNRFSLHKSQTSTVHTFLLHTGVERCSLHRTPLRRCSPPLSERTLGRLLLAREPPLVLVIVRTRLSCPRVISAAIRAEARVPLPGDECRLRVAGGAQDVVLGSHLLADPRKGGGVAPVATPSCRRPLAAARPSLK